VNPTRRRFIQAGLGGTTLLFVAGCARANATDVIPAIVPVVLAGALPHDTAERALAIGETVEAFHRAVGGLAPAIQDEVGDLLALLAFPATRILVAGVVPAWRDADAGAIAHFLARWRDSRFELKRSGARALTQLIQGAWYDNPRAWPVTGYPGPPRIGLALRSHRGRPPA